MSLAEDLKTPVRTVGSRVKPVMTAWVETLPPDEADAVLRAAVDTAWGHMDLARALVKNGAPEVSDTTFGKWRRAQGLRS